ncbi:MAG TPA: glycosyltransferase family 87 protein [Rhodopila sp.]|nr:glycosyltransferase family 87 protein [Rhodopila sp.]
MIHALPASLLLLVHLTATACGILVIRKYRWDWPVPAAMLGGLALVGLTAFSFAAGDPPPGHLFADFRIAYYLAGQAVLQHNDALRALVDRGVFGFVNLPIVAYLFAPLGMLPLHLAMVLFTGIGLGLAATAWWLLVRLADLHGRERWLLLFLFAMNGPLLYSVKEGNTSHWILFALALALALLQSGRRFAAGVVMGVATVLKLPLALFGLYFALRRDWRATLGLAGVCATTVALSVIVFGWDFVVHWYDVCVRQFSSQWLAAFNVQSLQSFMLRWDIAPERLLDWTAAPPTPVRSIALYIAVVLVYCSAMWSGFLASFRAIGPARTTLEFLLVVALALLTSPISWSHYYAWLLLPAAFFLGSRSPFADAPAARVIGWAAILLTTPLVRSLDFTDPTFMAVYVDFGASYLLFGGVLWFGLIAWSLATPTLRKPYLQVPAAAQGDESTA